ncbi:hypothetical protein ACIRYZ_44350 [Kitasatospora sp. NPDC101155]|uniref:hypothetical protein n=1 Tax=Kitasatospora sp. NPDC101155 TaxID=3364097 RepID=UPI00382BEA2A
MPTAMPSGAPDRRAVPGPGVPVEPRRTPAERTAPRRSRIGLAAQFVLQFVYIPLGILVAIGFVVLPFWAAATSGSGGGGSGTDLGDLARILEGLARSAISWRRLRTEWSGRPEEWETFTERLLTKRFSRAERKSRWAPHELSPSRVRRAVTHLWLHHHHGLAPTRVEQLAERHGWSMDWAKSTVVKDSVGKFANR